MTPARELHPPRTLPPPLDPPTTYRPTKGGRVGDVVAAIGATIFGFFPLYTAATLERSSTGVVWFFVTLVAVPAVVFAAQRVLRLRQAERIHVTTEEFVYHGPLRDVRVAWSDVIGATFPPYSDGAVDVHLKAGAARDRVRVPLDGLEPNRYEFMRQLYRFAPAALHYENELVRFIRQFGWRPRSEKLKPGYARPEEMPDFADMRAEAERILTGQDREDLLRSVDHLEREWKSRLDPSSLPQGKKP